MNNLDERLKNIYNVLAIDNFISELRYYVDKEQLEDFCNIIEEEYNIKWRNKYDT